jgi:hypothetical protein
MLPITGKVVAQKWRIAINAMGGKNMNTIPLIIKPKNVQMG